MTAMLDLETLNSVGNFQITTTFDANIMASATLVFSLGGTVAAQVLCRLEISDGTGPTNGLTPMGANLGANLTLLAAPLVFPHFGTMSLIGAAKMPPGTYNVQASCSALMASACTCNHPAFRNGHLNVWAIGN